jgi:hypothetical protein
MNELDRHCSDLDSDRERAETLIREQRAVIAALADLVCELMRTLAEYERVNPARDALVRRSYLN